MAIYHLSIKIISRAGGRSAIAAAAYRSGEKLENEETGIVHDFTHKGGVVMNEIMLPDNAPAEYRDREKLWNDVQRQEKRSDARFAREIEVAFPVEMSDRQRIECVRNFIKENFTDVGMIADWAYHNPDPMEHNPHAHIMLTVRGFTEEKEWDAKKRSVFANDRDEQGRPIYNPDKPSYDPKRKEETAQYRIPQLDKNGKQKFRDRKGKGREMLWERIDIPANDWDERANAEKWRSSWAEKCNQYLTPEQKIDHRSYERQGMDKEPTIHEGVTARKIERDGNISDRMQINRVIKEQNSIREKLKKLAEEITEQVAQKARAIYERFIEFTRSIKYSERPGRDDGNIGESAGGGREPERASGRIDELKRGLNEETASIQQAEQSIAETDRRIEELRQLTERKEREIDERLQKLRARRNAGHDGADAGRDRAVTIGSESSARDDLRSATDDINAFLAGVEAERQDIGSAERQSVLTAEQRRLEEQKRAAEQKRAERHSHHIR